VEDTEQSSGVNLEFDPVEETFGNLRYKWDDNKPYLLKIAAKHSSVARYLGERTENGYTNLDSTLYHTVLAEIASEALSFKLLEKLFKKEGEQGKLDSDTTDYYYHYYLSTFSPIAHKILVPVT
jgi:hypothetical protein